MIALVVLTKSMVNPKKPIDPATVEIIVMCSAPAKKRRDHSVFKVHIGLA